MHAGIKLCLVAAIWAVGIYFGATSSSDPAGQGYAIAIPIITSLIISIPFAFSIARTPVSEDAWRHKAWRILLYVPLAIAVSPVILMVGGFLIFLVLYFFKLVLLLGLAGFAIWFFVVSRRRRRARQIAAAPQPRAGPLVPDSFVAPPISVAPVAIPPKPPRVRRPVCGIWAWAVLLLAVPLGLGLPYAAEMLLTDSFQKGYMEMGLIVLPLFITVPLSLILAILSLCRRERYPGFAGALLVLYAIGLMFGAPVVLLIVGVILSAVWLVRQYRRRPGRTRSQT
jgi:hypothetical protein